MKILVLCLLLSGCTTIQMDIREADRACAGGDLDEYLYRDKKVDIGVKCKKTGEEE